MRLALSHTDAGDAACAPARAHILYDGVGAEDVLCDKESVGPVCVVAVDIARAVAVGSFEET